MFTVTACRPHTGNNAICRTDGRREVFSKKLSVGGRDKTLTMFTSRAPRQNPKLYYKSKSSVLSGGGGPDLLRANNVSLSLYQR